MDWVILKALIKLLKCDETTEYTFTEDAEAEDTWRVIAWVLTCKFSSLFALLRRIFSLIIHLSSSSDLSSETTEYTFTEEAGAEDTWRVIAWVLTCKFSPLFALLRQIFSLIIRLSSSSDLSITVSVIFHVFS